ncbi:MAG TPA: hypothetical protein VK737_06325 [Opitutales bacterium]|jgi:hypothetical protein|nr:hypothetical protein [Opitutales bacterium]
MNVCALIFAALAAAGTGDSAAPPAAATAAPTPAPVAALQPGAFFAHTVREGTTELTTEKGAAPRALTRSETFTASGQTVNAPNGLTLMLVLSNGKALFMPQGGRITLDDFLQDPVFFTDRDRSYEPSKSNLRLTLTLGTLVVSGRKPEPTSTFTLTTALAQFSFHAQSFVVHADADTVAVTLMDGTADITIPETGFRDTLLPGQTATLTRPNLHNPYPIKLGPILTADQQHFTDWLALATLTESQISFSLQNKKWAATQRIVQSFTQQTSPDDPRFR